MSTLQNFPIVSQLTQISGDGSSPNSQMDCVPACLCASAMYLNGVTQLDSKWNPDTFLDGAYPEGYHGGTDAANYVKFCAARGVHLFSVNGDTAQQVMLIHEYLAKSLPVVMTILDPYVPASYGWTHAVVAHADTSGEITVLDPYIAKSVTHSDSEWQGLLRGNVLWIAERIGTMGVPANWLDDGVTLTCPNGVKIVKGFRDYVLSHSWDSSNEALSVEYATAQLEDSNTSLGSGTQQMFRWSMLGWTASRGVFAEWLGVELAYARGQVAKYYTMLDTLNKQLASLQASAHPTVLSDMQQIKTIATKY